LNVSLNLQITNKNIVFWEKMPRQPLFEQILSKRRGLKRPEKSLQAFKSANEALASF
jgi:hypothetical protein